MVFIVRKAVLMALTFAPVVIFYAAGGAVMALVYLMLWADKAVLSHVKVQGSFGLELITIPVIIVGVYFGPLAGFIFGFIAVPFFDGIQYLIAPPLEVGWPPLAPSIDTFIIGLVALIAGLMAGSFPFLVIAITGAIAKNALYVVRDIFFHQVGKSAFDPAYILNVVANILVAVALSGVVTPLLK